MVRARWLRDLFESADKDSSGTLTMKEVVALMDDLNVSVSKKILKKMFKVSSSPHPYPPYPLISLSSLTPWLLTLTPTFSPHPYLLTLYLYPSS